MEQLNFGGKMETDKPAGKYHEGLGSKHVDRITGLMKDGVTQLSIVQMLDKEGILIPGDTDKSKAAALSKFMNDKGHRKTKPYVKTVTKSAVAKEFIKEIKMLIDMNGDAEPTLNAIFAKAHKYQTEKSLGRA